MECCGCVDLMELLIKKDTLSESHTRFYISELAAAINDLKPDNVLISNAGNIRLSDLWLAKSFKNGNDKQLSNWQQFVATLKLEQLEQEQKEEEAKVKKGKMSAKEKRKKLYPTVRTPFHTIHPLATCRKIVRCERHFKIPTDCDERCLFLAIVCVCVRYFKKFLTSFISLHISRSIHVSNGTGQQPQVTHIRSEI